MKGVYKRRCKICGSKFMAKTPIGCYCCDYCRKVGKQSISRASHRAQYKPRTSFREKVCAGCGKRFTGHFNAKYCDACLENGAKMHLYRDRRINTEKSIKEGET